MKTRPPLTREEIEQNADTYKVQIFKLLDPEKTVIDFNRRWLGTLDSDDWVRLTARYNVAQMLERRDFRQRQDTGQPIGIHEFLYPLAQAYDSIELRADVELGGTDQLFNLNVGRDIMPAYGLLPQIVMTVPLLVGLDGVEKMSKSLGNYVGVTELPDEMFGKLMSISDDLMWTYYELVTDLSVREIEAQRQAVASGALHPKRAKVELAMRIVSDFHSVGAATQAAEAFDRRFSRRELPGDLPVIELSEEEWQKPLAARLVRSGLADSMSDARRKIEQGAVRVDGIKASPGERSQETPISPDELTVQVGRRAIKLKRSSSGR